ncbi:hypothetical protein M878_45340 [Streptomyces roseochromogenus subsp. oscitans DS 12.976]|uniref:Uncharacterized protein n=1 Tax=Streptomyces roseochromogenus subsp. oscitans DS 12.976 TaxID=1352936 RepID=V6JNB4_STRRC|nr:hypothetical protein M878_45340 [Streptomyces roseochromogenus subsp. oscitans DS 12.976]
MKRVQLGLQWFDQRSSIFPHGLVTVNPATVTASALQPCLIGSCLSQFFWLGLV